MAYRVDYGPVKKLRGGERTRVPELTAVFLAVFFILVGMFWPVGVQTLRELLIPGDPSVTVAALEVFAQELGQGTGLAEAFSNFCDLIMRGTQGVPG